MVFLISKLSLHSKGVLLCMYVVDCITEWLYNFFWCSGVAVGPESIDSSFLDRCRRHLFYFSLCCVVLMTFHRFSAFFFGCYANDDGIDECNGFLDLWRYFCWSDSTVFIVCCLLPSSLLWFSPMLFYYLLHPFIALIMLSFSSSFVPIGLMWSLFRKARVDVD